MRRNAGNAKRKTWLVALFLVLVVGISFGYAAIQTTLTINGNTTINKVNWNIHFDNIQVTDGSVAIDTDAGDVAANISETDNTKVTYSATLVEPGDFYEFNVDVVNAGSLDALLSDIVKTELTDEQDVYTNYTVTYVSADENINGTVPAADDTLAAGETKTLKVRVEFDTNIEASQLPSEPHTMALEYQMLYVQDTTK